MPPSIQRLNPPTLPDAGQIGYSQISIVPPGPLAFVSGQVALRPDESAAPESLADQVAIVVENLQAALATLRAAPDDIVQMRIYMTNLNSERMEIVVAGILGFLDGAQPSMTGVGVTALAAPDLQVEVEMVVSVAPPS